MVELGHPSQYGEHQQDRSAAERRDSTPDVRREGEDEHTSNEGYPRADICPRDGADAESQTEPDEARESN